MIRKIEYTFTNPVTILDHERKAMMKILKAICDRTGSKTRVVEVVAETKEEEGQHARASGS